MSDRLEAIRRQNDANDAMLDAIDRDEDTTLSAFSIASMGVDHTRALLAEVERLQILVAWTRGFTLRRSDLAIERMGFPTGVGFIDWFDEVVDEGRALIDKAERDTQHETQTD